MLAMLDARSRMDSADPKQYSVNQRLDASTSTSARPSRPFKQNKPSLCRYTSKLKPDETGWTSEDGPAVEGILL